MKFCFHTFFGVLAALLTASTFAAQPNLIRNADFEIRQTGATQTDLPENYTLEGQAIYRFLGDPHRDFSSMGVALDSSAKNSADEVSGSVMQAVTTLDAKAGRWFRFSFRGLPQEHFDVKDGKLSMRVDFYGSAGKKYFDGVSKKLYALVEQERRDFEANGKFKKSGGAVWRTYQMDFRLPFPEIDELRLSVGFKHGCSSAPTNTALFVDDFSLERIPDPASSDGSLVSAQKTPEPPKPLGKLLPLGGHWFFDARNNESEPVRKFDAANVAQLFYKTGDELQTPFVGNVSAWMRAGFKDEDGTILTQDKYVADSVTLNFTPTHLEMKARNIPNHPTAKFPEEGFGPHNPSFIQAHTHTFYFPLNPEPNAKHFATDLHNANHALHMGPIGVAVNGVVFYNPFDAGNMDAANIVDRCCGHPSPDNMYHYHKYPVCVKSPWTDEGAHHSPLLGFAFDGFPVYGPYESAGLMAKDITGDTALNDFNMHYDKERGWHYHVTPGKFPYIIGGYWGTEDPRNAQRRGPPGGGGPGRPGFGPPGGFGPPPFPPR